MLKVLQLKNGQRKRNVMPKRINGKKRKRRGKGFVLRSAYEQLHLTIQRERQGTDQKEAQSKQRLQREEKGLKSFENFIVP